MTTIQRPYVHANGKIKFVTTLRKPPEAPIPPYVQFLSICLIYNGIHLYF